MSSLLKGIYSVEGMDRMEGVDRMGGVEVPSPDASRVRGKFPYLGSEPAVQQRPASLGNA